MQKSVLSLRLDSKLMTALDEVSLQASRTQVVTAILELFLAQNYAEQRRQLKMALLSRSEPIWMDRWPARHSAWCVESDGEQAHTSSHERVTQANVEAAQARDLSGSGLAEAGCGVAFRAGRNKAGC